MTKVLRILQVVDSYYPNTDGVVQVVDNYARLLNGKAECVVLAPKTNGNYNGNKYKLVKCMSINSGKIGASLALPDIDIHLRRYLKENKFDIIHCHSPVTLAKFIIRYAKRNNIPLVFTMHSKFHEEINRYVSAKPIQKLALNYLIKSIKKMDYIWAVSENSAKLLSEQYGVDCDCLIMRNGTDMDPSYASPEIAKKAAAELGITPDDFVLVTCGRIVSVKNFQGLISAVGILRDQGISVKLMIIGDGDYKEELQKQCYELSVEDRVIFVPKLDDRRVLASYFSLGKLFVLASTYDTSSLVIREGFALKIPALVVRGSAAAEGIEDNGNGFLAENTPREFADKISFIKCHPQMLAEASERCFNELYEPWSKIVDKVYAEYVSMLDARATALAIVPKKKKIFKH